ncbi:MAG: hypothetical protein VKO39_12035 [Cyanobacteriota bacterium]|nr:hypothetical protein [Cyanobacteriota bacterium]
MAPRSEDRKRTPTPPKAAPWALLWLGSIAGGTWVPLLLADRLPSPAGRRPLQPAPPLAAPPTVHSREPRRPILLPATPSIGSLPGAQRPESARSLSLAEATLRHPRTATLTLPAEVAPASLAPTPPISGSLLLGGPLGLESLREKPMVPAARLEQALRARSADRLEGVPPHWRPALRALVNGPERVLPAEVVRLPAPHVKSAEEYPMAVKPDGLAETSVPPPTQSKQTLERWAERQTPTPAGSVRPVLVVLEPLATEPEVEPQSEFRDKKSQEEPSSPPGP